VASVFNDSAAGILGVSPSIFVQGHAGDVAFNYSLFKLLENGVHALFHTGKLKPKIESILSFICLNFSFKL